MRTGHKPPNDIEVTLLALGKGYGLYGDRKGNVGRICDSCITGVKTLAPVRVYLDNPIPAMTLGLPLVLSDDLPEDKLFCFDRYRDKDLGIGVYAAFDAETLTWYVREILDGIEPTGRFFFTEPEIGVGSVVEAAVC